MHSAASSAGLSGRKRQACCRRLALKGFFHTALPKWHGNVPKLSACGVSDLSIYLFRRWRFVMQQASAVKKIAIGPIPTIACRWNSIIRKSVHTMSREFSGKRLRCSRRRRSAWEMSVIAKSGRPFLKSHSASSRPRREPSSGWCVPVLVVNIWLTQKEPSCRYFQKLPIV